MFFCDNCKKSTQSGAKQFKGVAKTRPKTYYDEKGHVEGRGRETVKELSLCESCFQVHKPPFIGVDFAFNSQKR